MTRLVNCVKYKEEKEGLEFPPYPGDIGVRIWENVSKQAWQDWMDIQTRLVNENRLNLADSRARKYLSGQMESYLFEGQDVEAQGYVPPSK